MKHTLKNRPQMQEIAFSKTGYRWSKDNSENYVRHISHCEEWFKGLEKELTKRLSDAEFSETKSIKNDTIIELIKEILGETTP